MGKIVKFNHQERNTAAVLAYFDLHADPSYRLCFNLCRSYNESHHGKNAKKKKLGIKDYAKNYYMPRKEEERKKLYTELFSRLEPKEIHHRAKLWRNMWNNKPKVPKELEINNRQTPRQRR